MYAEFKKAIYGTLEASLLFWAKLSKILAKKDPSISDVSGTKKMMGSQSRGEDSQTVGNSGTSYLRKILHHQPYAPRVSCYFL